MYIVSSFYLPAEGETAKGSWAREGLEVGGKAERWVGARQRDLRSGRASERAQWGWTKLSLAALLLAGSSYHCFGFCNRLQSKI
jgi:hypothetical protein